MLDRLTPMQALGAPVGLLYGLIYRLDRTNDAELIADELRRETGPAAGGAIRILNTTIPATVPYREAATAQIPTHLWEAKRSGPTPSARESMLSLVAELFPHLSGATLASEQELSNQEDASHG